MAKQSITFTRNTNTEADRHTEPENRKPRLKSKIRKLSLQYKRVYWKSQRFIIIIIILISKLEVQPDWGVTHQIFLKDHVNLY